jgi:hypothetical protein
MQEVVLNTARPAIAQRDELGSPRAHVSQFVCDRVGFSLQNDHANTIAAPAVSIAASVAVQQQPSSSKFSSSRFCLPPVTVGQAAPSPRNNVPSAILTAAHVAAHLNKKNHEPEHAVNDDDSIFIEKVNVSSGRPYWINLNTRVTSFIPPDGRNTPSVAIIPGVASPGYSAAASTRIKTVGPKKTTVAHLAAGFAGSRKSGGYSANHIARANADSTPPPPPPPDSWC